MNYFLHFFMVCMYVIITMVKIKVNDYRMDNVNTIEVKTMEW